MYNACLMPFAAFMSLFALTVVTMQYAVVQIIVLPTVSSFLKYSLYLNVRDLKRINVSITFTKKIRLINKKLSVQILKLLCKFQYTVRYKTNE